MNLSLMLKHDNNVILWYSSSCNLSINILTDDEFNQNSKLQFQLMWTSLLLWGHISMEFQFWFSLLVWNSMDISVSNMQNRKLPVIWNCLLNRPNCSLNGEVFTVFIYITIVILCNLKIRNCRGHTYQGMWTK